MSDFILKKGTRRYKICTIMLNDGGMTPESFIETHGLLGLKSPVNIKKEFDDLVFDGYLKIFKDYYLPTQKMKNDVRLEGVEYVKPREPAPFKPMSEKHYLPKLSPRNQPLRDFCHIGLSNGAKEEGSDNLSVLNEVLSGLQA